MSKLNVDQKTIAQLFQDRKANFLIPDYQRPYAWGIQECQTLWDDIYSFSIPDNDPDSFIDGSEYFLGSIVTFNNNGKQEVIDGQQRLTTLMLLLRAFLGIFIASNDKKSLKTKENIEKCLYVFDEFEEPDFNCLKISSEVATDDDKQEFMNILLTGKATPGNKSPYALNYRFFQEQIGNVTKKTPTYAIYIPTRVMANCILLPIEAESQDTALRIFSTLNDRGKPLSDADIFKAKFYKYYSDLGQKNYFISRWKALEERCSRIFHPAAGTAMDEIFTRYMYFLRAKSGVKASTTEALRKFYEKDDYSVLKDPITMKNLEELSIFWEKASNQDSEVFSNTILKDFFILNYAPNSMWTYFVSVYFMQNKDENGNLEENAFHDFLVKTIAFIWAYAIMNPGVNALRTPVYAEMINIIEGQPVTFDKFKFVEDTLRSTIGNYEFTNNRPITKSMLVWWAFQDDKQELLSIETLFETEHIYARKRQENEQALSNPRNLESLGNKAILEKKINIRASEYRFKDKKKYYLGFQNAKGEYKDGTKVSELIQLASTKDDFTEQDIINRYNRIVDSFINYLKENNLIA